jgi:hypothetical protein
MKRAHTSIIRAPLCPDGGVARSWIESSRMKIPAIIYVVMICLAVPAMDRWSALSMIESGDDDLAVGAGGEVSRFQIRSELWPGGNAQDARDALSAAREIMKPRLEEFLKNNKRPATDFEFYVLWNAPWEVDHPSKAVAERAQRFSNLVRRELPVTPIN